MNDTILRHQEMIMDDTHRKLDSAVDGLCYDGFLPDEIAEMARSIAQKFHEEIDERIAQNDEPENRFS